MYNPGSVRIAEKIREILIMLVRPARVLECLEFDPDDFAVVQGVGDMLKALGSQNAATAPSATWMQSKPARRSRGRQPLSQPNTRSHSQPSPRHKGAWATRRSSIGRGGNSQASTAAERFDSRGTMPHGR